MDKKELIETLNNLLETCKDGEKGFNTCAEHLKQEELRVICRDRAKSCEQAANELKGLIQAQGGEPQERSSAAGALPSVLLIWAILGLVFLMVRVRSPAPARTSSMRFSGISDRKREGLVEVSRPCRRRTSAQVKYSCSMARVMPT